jgi:RNA polymerase sigma factor (sigma-70 family)
MANARSGITLRQIQRLFDQGSFTGLTDAQLLDRFVIQRDEGAFAILVERHGPMVLAVCQGVLNDMNDAEDAFQATFLVLFRKAGGLRAGGSLGSWLYRVAYRIAIRANAVVARRRERPWEESAMAGKAAPADAAEIDRETLPIIHQEIDRLPEKYRAPIALCFLEDLSYEEAARQLGWPLGTVGSRLARAKDVLRFRLTRRGITATSAAVAALLSREAKAAPAGWVEATTRAVFGLDAAAKGARAVGAVSAMVALSEHVLRRMLVIKLIQMTALLTAVATAGLLAWTSIGAADQPKRQAAPTVVAIEAQAQRAEPPRQKDQKDQPGQVPIQGRVIGPDGKPVRDASIYLSPSGSGWLNDPIARTDAEGRFQIDPNHAFQGILLHIDSKAELTAAAPGYGPIWAKLANSQRGDVELRLVPDDVPLRGRVVDIQGQPVRGVNVLVFSIQDPPKGDLDALLQTGTIRDGAFSGGYYTAAWFAKDESGTVRPRTIKTGPDGRFQIDGAGRDRLVVLELDGPGIERSRLWAMTRVAPPQAKPRAAPAIPKSYSDVHSLHGATFDHVAGPSKPIEGVIRAKGTREPLAGIRVSCFAPETGLFAYATSDKVGRFRLDGLPKAESYRVQADPLPGEPYFALATDVTGTDGLEPIPVTLELVKGVVVRVRLMDKATGKSVAGLNVDYTRLPPNNDEGLSRVRRFGPEGYQMPVPPGPLLFFAEAEGTDLLYIRPRLAQADRGKGVALFGDADVDGPNIRVIFAPYHTYRIVDVPADVDTFAVDLELTRGLSRKGRLIGPDGKPVVGVSAYGLAANWQVKTLDDGTFEAVGLEPGRSRTVSFIHKDRKLAGAVLIEPGEGPVEVRLVPWGTATGRLVDGDGQPLRGATLQLQPLDHQGQAIPFNVSIIPFEIGIWPLGEVFTADQDGRFRVEGINPDLSVYIPVHPRSRPDVFLMPEKSKRAMLEHVTAKPGETVDLGEIHLTP